MKGNASKGENLQFRLEWLVGCRRRSANVIYNVVS